MAGSIIACCESLLRLAVEEYRSNSEETEFWDWIASLRGEDHNQVCRFWAQMLLYLHVYAGFYFAVRSGNWLLRNSCLKILSYSLHILVINMK